MEHLIKNSAAKISIEDNLRGYELINIIENGFREFIIAKMKENFGPSWRESLPQDLITKYKQGFKNERNHKWIRSYIHHPLYYLDFPDLQKIIIFDKLWNQIFKENFQRKDLISSELSSLEASRNIIAHNRRVHSQLIQSLESKIETFNNFIKPLTLEILALNQSSCVNIQFELGRLIKSLDKLYSSVKLFKTLDLNLNETSIVSEWWFDDTVFGFNHKPISNFIDFAKKYANFPCDYGKGHIREKFAIENKHEDLYKCCIDELQKFYGEVANEY